MLAQPLLDPKSIARLASLKLRAAAVVEGFLTGMHQSPYHGFSVEFSQHRQYIPGDSLRHLDYKVLAKTGKYYIKQYQEETNLKGYILLDHSGSMGFKCDEKAAITKLQYASTLSAALSLLLLRQRDAVGMITFSEKVTSIMPPRSAMGYLEQLLLKLENLTPSGETTTSSALLNIAERVTRKGMVLLISDLFDDPQSILAGLKALRHVGHDVIVFQIMDPLEISFAFPRDARFKDLENNKVLPSRPWHIRNEYQKEVSEFIDYYRQKCRENRIDYHLMTTDNPYSVALFQFLERRSRLM